MALVALVVLLALLVADRCDDADIFAVWTTADARILGVSLDTCNADVSVAVEEHDDRIVLSATHHDWYRYLFGRDDCSDGVLVELDAPLGSRSVENSSGDEIPFMSW